MTSDLSHILTTPKYNMTKKVNEVLPNVMYKELYSVYKTCGVYDLQLFGSFPSSISSLLHVTLDNDIE